MQLKVPTSGARVEKLALPYSIALPRAEEITIPAEVKHWHGAKADSWFSHIAVEVPGEATRNEWCEPVDDEAYNRL